MRAALTRDVKTVLNPIVFTAFMSDSTELVRVIRFCTASVHTLILVPMSLQMIPPPMNPTREYQPTICEGDGETMVLTYGSRE